MMMIVGQWHLQFGSKGPYVVLHPVGFLVELIFDLSGSIHVRMEHEF